MLGFNQKIPYLYTMKTTRNTEDLMISTKRPKSRLATATYIIHQRTDDGWKMVKRTTNLDDIHPVELWYFDRIMQEDLDYIVAGDTMYDIIYPNEFR